MSDTNGSRPEDAPADITDLAHDRGSDGQLRPIEKTIEVRGEGTATVEVRPATTGQRNEWRQRLEAEADSAEMRAETRDDLFDAFLPYGPEDFGGASSWDDIRPALEDALANAIFTELFDITENDFTQAIQDAVAERETAGNRT